MASDPAGHRRLFYFSGCMSLSCVPVHEEYSRIRLPAAGDKHRGRRWRKLIKKLVREGKNIYGSKPQSFQYDAISYSQNFDEGCHKEEYYDFHCQNLGDFKRHLH